MLSNVRFLKVWPFDIESEATYMCAILFWYEDTILRSVQRLQVYIYMTLATTENFVSLLG